MCIQLSTEKWETHPGLLFFCAEVIRGEGRTASSPVLGPSTSASSLMLQYVKQRSCKQFLSLYLNILKRTENLHWFVSRFWNPVCLCSSAQVRKVKEHNPGVLVLFCWAAVGFRAFQVWFFWTELSEQVFSMQMVYFSGTCEPCLCKQGRRKLGVSPFRNLRQITSLRPDHHMFWGLVFLCIFGASLLSVVRIWTI